MRFREIKATVGGLLVAALIAAGAGWGVQCAVRPEAASRVFFERGRDLFGDFRMPRVCAEWGYANDRQPRRDSCYPALGSLLVKPFPFDAGGWFTGLGVLLWAASFLVLVARRRGDTEGEGTRAAGALMAGLLSAPLLFAAERGNPVLYAAAGSVLFVAWHDAESRWKRVLAGVALAMAAALKIVPAALGVLVLGARRHGGTESGTSGAKGASDGVVVKGACLAALGAALFFVPFLWCGGAEGFRQWLDNAAANASFYSHTGAWGFVAVGRLVRSAVLHMDVTQPWPGMGLERLANAVLGLGCLAAAVRALWTRRSDGTPAPAVGGDALLLVTAAMLLVPGNMHYYAGIYLLPVLALRLREGMGWCEAACWFALLCPVQIPLGAGSLNRPLANLAFMGLLALAGVRRRKGFRHDA